MKIEKHSGIFLHVEAHADDRSHSESGFVYASAPPNPNSETEEKRP